MLPTSVTTSPTVQPSAGDPAHALIVETVQAAVGTVPVILGGSRATGQHSAESDYDIVVVLAAARVPLAIRPLADLARSLSARLGVDVAINPLPASRLRRFDRNLFIWKLCREGLVLSSPPAFRLPAAAQPVTSDLAAISYLLSAALYLIEHLDPVDLRASELPLQVQRGVRKALLHIAQLRLLRRGCHAPGLDGALAALGSRRLEVAGTSTLGDGWFGVRHELLRELQQRSLRFRISRSVSRNFQYAAVSRLRGQPRWWAMTRLRSVESELAEVIIDLLCAVEPGGGINAALLRAASAALPAPLRQPTPRWRELRDVVVAEWKSAHPLLSL
jgi:hypothetical protein